MICRCGKAGTPTATTDKVFLLSSTEVYGDWQSDGTQYEYYKSKGVTISSYSGASSSCHHWTRSVFQGNSACFLKVTSDGKGTDGNNIGAVQTYYVCPAWCF